MSKHNLEYINNFSIILNTRAIIVDFFEFLGYIWRRKKNETTVLFYFVGNIYWLKFWKLG